MKKLIVLVLLLFISSPSLQAQAKWRKELVAQVAALQVYMDYAKKGYTIAKKGIGLIGDFKKAEVGLHRSYFNSLKEINPKIKNYTKVAEIVLLQLKIIKICNSTFKQLRQDDLFNGNELDYIERSFKGLFENCDRTLEELLVVTTATKIEMKDDQRIERIDGLYSTMIEDYTFCQAISSQTKLLCLAKAKERRDVKVLYLFNGL